MSITISEPREKTNRIFYDVTLSPDDWAAFADAVENLAGDSVAVLTPDVALQFDTARERSQWADGFREGQKFATRETAVVDYLESWVKEQTSTDEMDKEAAQRRGAICGERMSPQTRDRAARLVTALTRWRQS